MEGEVLIVFQPDARPEDVRAILKDIGSVRVHVSRRSHVERHKVRMPVADAVAKYRHHPAIKLIEPNYLVHVDAVPNDPSFPIQWSLQNTGQQGGTPGDDIHAVPAWDQTTGSNQVLVAVVDTGMDMTHPDLVDNLYTNPGEIPGNGIDDDGNGFVDDVHGFDFANFDGDPTDDNGHGTHVAGTIGAHGNDGIGIAGVVWHVRLLPLKFLDAQGTGTTSDAVDCIDYAVQAGAQIINASWGSGEQSLALELAIQGANDAGVLFVAAAGNAGSDNDRYPNFPSNFPEPNVIAVGSTGRMDDRSPFSNYGATTVDLFAPGLQILSTLPNGQYGLASGTSMATPHVSGALALLKSRFPGMSAPTMKQILLAATDRVPGLAGYSVTGGRLNVARMLDGVDSTDPGPIGDLASSLVSSDRVSVTWTATGDDGGVGTATDYELRYSLSPIDSSSFASGVRVAGVAAPQPAGTREEASIRGLQALTTYYVALIAHDEFGNPSPLSNVITVRTTAPPVATVTPPSSADTLRTGQRITFPLDVRNDGAGSLDFIAKSAGAAGAPAPTWLSVAPLSGSAPAGTHVTLTAALNAAKLRGGDYAAIVHLDTNDPAHPAIDVPVSLHVIPAPDIEVFPSPLTFGPIVVGASDTQSVLVSNTGFADLHVDSVSVEGAGFTADPTPFDLTPGGAWEIFVTAAPTRTGAVTGALTIHSNDPDTPVVRIVLGANGIIAPTAAISPTRQDASVHTGETTTRTFQITNAGGSTLFWSLRARSAAALDFDSTGALVPPAGASARAGGSGGSAPDSTTMKTMAVETADLSDVRIVFDSRHGASSGAWSTLVSSLVSRGALFSLNTQPLSDSVLAGADVYWMSDDAGFMSAVQTSALAAWVRRGGSLVMEGDAAGELPIFNNILDSLGVPLDYESMADAITGAATRVYPYEITRDVTNTFMPGSLARLRVAGPGPTVLLEDAHGRASLAAAFVGRGRVLAVSCRLFSDVSTILADNQRVAAQSFDWLGGVAWLSIAPGSGATASGQSTPITITFDGARLMGAPYRGALVVRSNDPARGEFLMPVDLSVTSAPDVQASPASVDFGSVFVGASTIDSITVRNVGVLPLRIGSVSIDQAAFKALSDSLTLAPGAVSVIPVRYAPTSIGPAQATASFATDDPDQPEVRVPITGAGIPAPDMAVAAGDVSAALPTGGKATRTITVANRAGSDLQFRVHFEEEAPAASLAAAGATAPALALPRTWSEARDAALAMTGRTVLPVVPDSAASLSRVAAAMAPDSLPIVVVDGRGDGGVSDLFTLRAWARAGILTVSLETVSDLVVTNFGGFVSLDIDQNVNTGRAPSFGNPRQDVGVEYEVSLFSLEYGLVDLYDARSGTYQGSFPVQVTPRTVTFAIPLSRLGGDDGRMNVSGVIGNYVQATDWFPDHGHGTIGGLWLAPSPSSATVPAGTVVPVQLAIDALDLPGGAYNGSIVVESNDPSEPIVQVPASLSVTDAPVAAVNATRVDLGDVFLGRSARGEVVVANEGRAPLTVASITIDDTTFTAAPSAFAVAPGGTQVVALTFTPLAAGSRSPTLTVNHDAAGGPLTVLLSGQGVAPPVARVGPASIETTVSLGSRGAATFSVANTGGSLLTYGVEPMNGAPVAVQPGLALARDEEDPRPGISTLGVGGPDAFGYRWADSNQFGGPIFEWVDISAIGTPVPIRTLDQNSGPIPIGFTFPFYGHDFTTFNVCTHGWISFTDTTVQFANQPLPNLAAPNNVLAVFWDDLNFAGEEHAAYYNDGSRLIVQFTNVQRRQRGGPFTFEAILYPSGAIVYQYLLMGPPTNSGTIGIQNAKKNDGLTVLFNADYLRDRMAIRISASPPWLGVADRFGSVESGGSATVGVTFDARGLAAGSYPGTLRIQTNDPDHPESLIPVLLHARGIPRIALSPQSLRFDTLDVGTSAVDTLRITDAGNDSLRVGPLAFGLGDFTAAPATLALAPLQSGTVLVRFAPAAEGDRSTSLGVASNDPATPLAVVPIAAAARLPLRRLSADVSPRVIQRGSRGQEVRVRILMPADLDATKVVLAGIRFQDVVPPDLATSRVRDVDGDGVPDLDLAFARAAAEAALADGDHVPVRVTGVIPGRARIEGDGVVRVLPTRLAAPGVAFEGDEVPAVTALRGSAPNPFGGAASIRFDLASGGRATLRVYGAGGRLIRTLVEATLPAGRFRADWDGRDDRGAATPSGVYFAALEVSGPAPFRGVHRLIRVR